MKYNYMDGYIEFDNIYPIKEIEFDQNVDSIKWSINLELLNEDSFTIKECKVLFNKVHLRYIVVDSNVKIVSIKRWDGFTVSELPEVNNVFRRNSGWAGADGVFSHRIKDKIHWYFSDTLVGDVDPITRMRKEFVMVNNTVGVSDTKEPFKIDFNVKEDKDGKYTSYYVPHKEGYYWLQDGCVKDGYLYISVIRVKNDPKLWFIVLGAEMLKVPIVNNLLDYDNYSIIENKGYFHQGETIYTFGVAILDDTSRSGYYYMFGYDNQKKRNLYMIRLSDFEDDSTYEFFTETGWLNEPVGLRSIGEDVSHEMRVIYDKGYVLSFTRGCVGTDIVLAFTEELEKGFTEYTTVYQSVEMIKDPTLISYNAKIHTFPNDNSYYASYNINTNIIKNLENAETYYPRWIKITKGSD